MKTTPIREQIYEFIRMYVDTPEPKKLCSSIEDLVDELAESKVKKLALPDVVKSLPTIKERDIELSEMLENYYEDYERQFKKEFKFGFKHCFKWIHDKMSV